MRVSYKYEGDGIQCDALCDELLACANTHGKKFFATGGSHVCSDDFFKAQALLVRESELAEKEVLKKTLHQKLRWPRKGW